MFGKYLHPIDYFYYCYLLNVMLLPSYFCCFITLPFYFELTIHFSYKSKIHYFWNFPKLEVKN